jgi:geranylgeranyl reductase family protein
VEKFDVAVVGAGPAGSTTAYRLARAHARVLLIDKAHFPRDKPCGGGLTMRAVRQLPFPVEPVVEDRITRVRCRLKYGRTMIRHSDEVLCLMTQRRRLDQFLVERAAEAGADFRDGVHVEVESDRRIRVGGAPIEVDAVVGADGANGVTAKALGLGGAIVQGVALEGNLPYERLPYDDWRGMLVLELATLPGGYGWIFPKGSHLNVGVGGWKSEAPNLRAHLARLCEAHGFDRASLTDVRAHHLPFRKRGSSLAVGKIALIGDAAGLADPLSGDGIYEAALSARFAAEHALRILAGDQDGFDGYARELTACLSPLMRISWPAKYAFDRFPKLSFTIAKTPQFWKLVTRMMLGEYGRS